MCDWWRPERDIGAHNKEHLRGSVFQAGVKDGGGGGGLSSERDEREKGGWLNAVRQSQATLAWWLQPPIQFMEWLLMEKAAQCFLSLSVFFFFFYLCGQDNHTNGCFPLLLALCVGDTFTRLGPVRDENGRVRRGSHARAHIVIFISRYWLSTCRTAVRLWVICDGDAAADLKGRWRFGPLWFTEDIFFSFSLFSDCFCYLC